MNQALTTLSRALGLAEPEGYVRTFIERGAPMGHLLKQAIARGISASYANKLLTALEGKTKDKESVLPVSRQVEGRGIAALIEPLSEREREVLRLLITHLSRSEIADRLGISMNTVRFHVKNIYSKLGVHSRSDAVQRAEDMNLL